MHVRAIKKSILLFSLPLFILSPIGLANQLTVSVTEQPRAFNIDGKVCLYNATSKSSLNNYTLQLIEKQLLTQRQALAEELQLKLGLNLEVANQAPVVAAFKASSQQLQHDYSNVGNDLCTKVSGSMPIEDKPNIQQLVSFPLAKEHHWIASQTEHLNKASALLQQKGWPIDNGWINKSTTLQAQFLNGGKTERYYTFDLGRYAALLAERNKTVFVSVKDAYQSGIKQYFSEHGFKIVDGPKAAHWNLTFSISPTADNLTINVTAKSNDETISLRNQHVDMASTNTNEPLSQGQINKLINVYLTMMELSEQLSFDIDDA